jgi:uroporphyrinogen decarboxylase
LAAANIEQELALDGGSKSLRIDTATPQSIQHILAFLKSKGLQETAKIRRPSEFQGAILVIDDEPDAANLICNYLTRRGYRTESVFNGEEAMVKMLSAPDVFEACVEQVFRFSSTYIERFVAVAGKNLDILYLADDFASQRGLLVDPRFWRKFLKPRYERLFAVGKRLGLPVWFHSCGDITAVLPDLIEIGMDVWETVQLHALAMTPEKLKQESGRHIAFFGGVNTQALPFRTPGEVAEEVRRCIDVLGQGGGYICGPDHHVKPDVPAANVVALFETARTYARIGYTENTIPGRP